MTQGTILCSCKLPLARYFTSKVLIVWRIPHAPASLAGWRRSRAFRLPPPYNGRERDRVQILLQDHNDRVNAVINEKGTLKTRMTTPPPLRAYVYDNYSVKLAYRRVLTWKTMISVTEMFQESQALNGQIVNIQRFHFTTSIKNFACALRIVPALKM